MPPVNVANSRHRPRSLARRAVTGLFGLFFILLAIGIVLSIDGPPSLGELVAALSVGALGIDACLAAICGTRSLLERIGPLP